MITSRKYMAAILGFAFVAAWIGFNFGYAVLCLLGAAAFYFAASYLDGEVDLADLPTRFGRAGPEAHARPGPAAPRRPRVR